jgi:hypothetical protein
MDAVTNKNRGLKKRSHFYRMQIEVMEPEDIAAMAMSSVQGLEQRVRYIKESHLRKPGKFTIVEFARSRSCSGS